MKILGGVAAPTTGTFELAGQELTHLTVAGSIRAGIAFLPQGWRTAPTVAELIARVFKRATS